MYCEIVYFIEENNCEKRHADLKPRGLTRLPNAGCALQSCSLGSLLFHSLHLLYTVLVYVFVYTISVE